MVGPALVAEMLVEYMEFLPITRELSWYGRVGIALVKSTAKDDSKTHANSWNPYLTLHIRAVLSRHYLQMPVKVLDQGKLKGTRKSYHCVYYSPPVQIVMFDFQQRRD